jgi:hypothetical protein
MLYFDYTWDIDPTSILFDEELNAEKLGWEVGDVFRLVEVEGRTKLVKVHPLEKFVRGKDE